MMHPHTPQPEQAAVPVAKAEQQHRCTSSKERPLAVNTVEI